MAERIVAEGRIASAALGRQLALIHEMSRQAPVPQFAPMELACLLGLTRFAAETQVRLAFELCERLPDVLAALSNADIDLARARVFTEVLSALEMETARQIASSVLPIAPAKTTGLLRDLLRRKALAADPAYVTARRKQAETRRSVQLYAADDGTAALTAFGLDPARAAAAFARIGAIARARHAAGTRRRPGSGIGGEDFGTGASFCTGVGACACADVCACAGGGSGRTLEQIRADVFLELLEGSHTSAPAGVIQLEVSVETLAGLDNNPGKLSAYGPVAADIARQLAQSHQDSQWQFAVRATDGTLLLQGLTRARPPQQNPADRFANTALTRWIRLRDRTCRAPGCRMPAMRTQIDHTIRHSDGGLTQHGNLGALCEYHHHAKDNFGGWQLCQTTPGHFTWKSPRGKTYHVKPDPP